MKELVRKSEQPANRGSRIFVWQTSSSQIFRSRSFTDDCQIVHWLSDCVHRDTVSAFFTPKFSPLGLGSSHPVQVKASSLTLATRLVP